MGFSSHQPWRDRRSPRRRLNDLRNQQLTGKPVPEPNTPEYVVYKMRTDLLVFGFAAVKEIAKARKETAGSMPCPLCQEPLIFSVAMGHYRALCSKAECINIME